MTLNLNKSRHADLVDRMATTLGLDLDRKVLEGRLDPDTLEDAVLACTGCADVEGCERWLATREEQAEAAPSACRNAALFRVLKQGGHV
jgi:hypothetical protein